MTPSPCLRLPGISSRDYQRFSQLIREQCGLKLPPVKKGMVEARLRKRLRQLGMKEFEEYGSYVFSRRDGGEELVHLLDAVTTNQTSFFREPKQFEYLAKRVLPEILVSTGSGRPLAFWSAGCSTGEEAFSLAMLADDLARQYERPYFVLGSDVSTRALKVATRAVYAEERIQPIPAPLRQRYLLRSKDRSRGLYRIVPELRAHCRFRRVNFMAKDYGILERIDVIFCRNVMIYFDSSTQERVLNLLCRYLAPGGYMFMGTSETLLGLDVPLVRETPLVYRRM